METTRHLVEGTNRIVTTQQQCRASKGIGRINSNKRRQVVKLISSPQTNRRLSTVCRWHYNNNNYYYNNNNNKTALTLVSVLVASLALLTALTSTTTANSLVYANPHQQAATNDKTSATHHIVASNQAEQQQRQLQRSDLEAELNSIVQQQQQQQETLDGNNKLLAEAIISHLMLDNVNAPGMTSSSSGSSSGTGTDLETDLQAIVNANDELLGSSESVAELAPTGEQVSLAQQTAREPNALEAQRLRKLLSFLRNYEAGSYLNSAQSFSPFPLLPSGQAATMKRAVAKMNAYLQTPSQQRHLSGGVQTYGRNSFDFGLGKRPDSSIAGNILRFGDSSMGVNGGSGSIQPVGSFGKRPSAQRYDFGLGKRVANPAYPRYDFGLGKRAPNRIRYDFGLGK